MSVAMSNYHSLSVDISSNVLLPLLMSRCQPQCEIAILDDEMSEAMLNCLS